LILLSAILVGGLAGLIYTRLRKQPWTLPQVRFPWLVIVAFLPQFFAFFLPITRARIPDTWAAVSLVSSEILFLLFCWINHSLSGFWLLLGGTVCNLVAIGMNGGFMPISPQTASHLVPAEILATLPLGERFGAGKDILLQPADTLFFWMSDVLLLPGWVKNQVAFSVGDILIACGAFWLMAARGKPRLKKNQERK
jgi:hypothetical protein